MSDTVTASSRRQETSEKTDAQRDFLLDNQRALVAALERLRVILQAYLSGQPGNVAPAIEPPMLASLRATFGLTAFERDLLLLAAGVEMDSEIGNLCAQAQGGATGIQPTFGLALSMLPDGHWSALAPTGPLRSWRLLEVGPGPSLIHSPLQIDERILHFLAGLQHLDERLACYALPADAHVDLVPSHRRLAEHLAGLCQQEGSDPSPVVALCGGVPADRRLIAAVACDLASRPLWRLASGDLPAGELDRMARLWEREQALAGSILLLECDELDGSRGSSANGLVRRFIERAGFTVFVSSKDRLLGIQRPMVVLEAQKPSRTEQRSLWQQVLGPAAGSLNGQLDGLVAQFDLSAHAIHSAAQLGVSTGEDDLWQVCRQQTRLRLDDLAQRVAPAAGWKDLVLPRGQLLLLREIAAAVRQRTQVYDVWGFARKSSRGLGISALFVGTSGTGKTMAAEVLAQELQLDLYCIDLSQVVSKYIGETEKNLRRVFDAAEESGAILLFDEADALFGKRSEVKDSHDRYANIEVSYLLQRMEAYRGLAILTSNMKSALDPAFMRRLRFVVQFPFPDSHHRAEIWRGVFPQETPTEGLQPKKLARLNLAGGNIRNIALGAAFLAADQGQPVRAGHILRAARAEYAKLEKPMSELDRLGLEQDDD
ncbi:MAG: ATP-binding protein [Chloroflexota bacterium]|nr:ATP-binding protein [Chloroflexota bacterium]